MRLWRTSWPPRATCSPFLMSRSSRPPRLGGPRCAPNLAARWLGRKTCQRFTAAAGRGPARGSPAPDRMFQARAGFGPERRRPARGERAARRGSCCLSSGQPGAYRRRREEERRRIRATRTTNSARAGGNGLAGGQPGVSPGGPSGPGRTRGPAARPAGAHWTKFAGSSKACAPAPLTNWDPPRLSASSVRRVPTRRFRRVPDCSAIFPLRSRRRLTGEPPRPAPT